MNAICRDMTTHLFDERNKTQVADGLARFANKVLKIKPQIPLNNVIRPSSVWLLVRQKFNIKNVISTKSLILFSINTGLDREPSDYE